MIDFQTNLNYSMKNRVSFKAKTAIKPDIGLKNLKDTKDYVTKLIDNNKGTIQNNAELQTLTKKILALLNGGQPLSIDFFDAYRMHKAYVDKVWGMQIDNEFKKSQELYKKIIKRCTDDIDNAIIEKRPQKEVDRLFEILEIFTTKYGHFGT